MYQKHTLIGNLGKDPELKNTPSGKSVATFSMAVNETWTDRDGEKQERVTWYRVQAWGKLAEIVSEYLTKGRQVFVEGSRLEVYAFTNEDGDPAATLTLTADTIKFLGGNGNGNSDNGASTSRRHEVDEDIPF